MLQMEKVIETLLTKFQPGLQTHFYVLTTLSDLATANPMGIVPHLTGILGTMLANIKSIKADQLKFAYANAFSRYLFDETLLTIPIEQFYNRHSLAICNIYVLELADQ